MLGETLEGMGYQVTEASTGADALADFLIQPSDVVITDLLMPEVDGFETIRQLKTISPALKVIAMSGGGRIGSGRYLDVAKNLGAEHTLKKPFTRTELVEALHEVLGE